MAKLAAFFGVSIEDLKQYDHRESLSDLKRLLEQSSSLNVAFRTAIEEVRDGTLSPEQLARRINPPTKNK
jgi:hypothetical protein